MKHRRNIKGDNSYEFSINNKGLTDPITQITPNWVKTNKTHITTYIKDIILKL